MENPSCVFDLSNEGEEEIFLYLEPEGAEFLLRPNCKVKFHLCGTNDPIEMKHWIRPEDRKAAISVWPVSGEFDLFIDGRSVWEDMG